MAGPYLKAANAGIQHNQTETFLGEPVTHGDAVTVLNAHSETKPSSAPTALFGAGLPWYYEPTDTHLAGVFTMIEHILSHEGDDGEIAALLRHADEE